MRMYFAPMEGITDAIFRQVYQARFGGMDKYFMPFVSPSYSLSYTLREEFDLLPAQNRGLFAVPQILARDAGCFLGAARSFAEHGYTEVNLNLGCPSGTVTGKGKGSAMLKDTQALYRFLDEIYCEAPLKISVKTRIGFDHPEEWEKILPVFSHFPIHELIIHPRTRSQIYQGQPHPEAFRQAMEQLKCPLIYNGDLFTAQKVQETMAAFPAMDGMMLGRGLLSNPALLREWNGGSPLSKEDLTGFHDDLFRAYWNTWHPLTAVGRMHVFLKYFAHSLDVPFKYVREALRANKPEEYLDAVGEMFARATMAENPRYVQKEQ